MGHNNPEAERCFGRREEKEWPIARTQYTRFFLSPNLELKDSSLAPRTSLVELGYRARGTLDCPSFLQFATQPFLQETEITGHITAHLNVSVTPDKGVPLPSDIDLFVTIHYISPSGKEVHYTGTAGDPVPLTMVKGWLRVSLRKVNTQHLRHREYLPYCDYFESDLMPVIPGEVYPVDIEIWSTNVVVEKGGKLIFEVSSGDSQGSGIFQHTDSTDRY